MKKSLLLRPGQVIRHVCASGIAMFWGSRQAILAASEAPEGSGRLNPHAKTAQYRPEICTMSRNRQKKHRKVIHPIFLATLKIQYISIPFIPILVLKIPSHVPMLRSLDQGREKRPSWWISHMEGKMNSGHNVSQCKTMSI